MKKLFFLNILIFMFAAVLVSSTAFSYSLIDCNPVYPWDNYFNPDTLDNSGNAEEVWLEGLLEKDVVILGKDEQNFFDGTWVEKDQDGNIINTLLAEPWEYAILKFGNGNTAETHWAFSSDGTETGSFADYLNGFNYFIFDSGIGSSIDIFPGIDGDKLSHITYAAPVPEPATMLLFGSGLIGLMGFRRKLKKA